MPSVTLCFLLLVVVIIAAVIIKHSGEKSKHLYLPSSLEYWALPVISSVVTDIKDTHMCTVYMHSIHMEVI